MMERRRALTIPFGDTEKLMENPLKIPMARLSSECGKLEAQVSWTAFADCKYKTRNSSHKNGSKMFACNHTPLKTTDILRRKPRLILRDVLKTEPGKDYIERIKMSRDIRRLSSPRKDHGRRKEEGLPCNETRTGQTEERNKNVTPKGKQKTPTPQRPPTRNRKSRNGEFENQDIKEVIIGKDKEDEKEEKFGEVVDCGLSLSWKPAGATTTSEGINTLTGSEDDVKPSSKRKRKDPGLQCNGTSSPKRQRGSMLCQTGEGGKDAGRVSVSVGQEESEEDGDLESMDRCIVQFTVGGEDGLEPLVPIIPHVEPEGIIFSSKLSLSPMNQTGPSDPIVLSSDEEETSEDPNYHSKLVQKVASMDDTVIYRSSSKVAVSQQKAASDAEEAQMLQLLVEELPPSAPVSPLPEVDYSSLSVPFFAMYCGCYKVKAIGGLMIAKHKIIIPLKGASEHLAFERKELRKYSVWDQQELEDREIHFDGDENPSPLGVLLFYVTEAAAAAIQQELFQLCLSEDGPLDTGKASPFILLTLKDPLEGMEGALLRSVLDIDCINRMTHEHSIANSDGVGLNSLFDSDSPVLTLDESIRLIRRTGVDTHLLSILGMKSSDSDLSIDQGSSYYEEEIPTAHIWVDTNFDRDLELDLEMAAEDGEVEASDGEVEAASAEYGEAQTAASAEDGEMEETASAAEDGEVEAAAEDGEVEAAAEDGEVQAKDGEVEAAAEDGEVEAAAEDGEVEAAAEDGQVEAAAENRETEAEPKEDKEDEEPKTPDSKKEEVRPLYTVCHHRRKGSYSVSLCKPDLKWKEYKHEGLTQRLIQFPPPPLKGGITVTMEDLQCLDSGQYLNDVIIDFYLKYLIQNASTAISERSHIFSSFFYKQLTRRDNASEGSNSESCQRQRRHQRVKTWTRHVDIFNKDFLFVPVNQEAHWYLVVICFPGLDEPQMEDWLGEGQDEGPECKSSNDHTEPLVRLEPRDGIDTETENGDDEASKNPPPPCPVSCTEKTCLRRTVCRRPCILIMDSLKLSSHERICKLLREYLQSEWEVRRGSSRDFGLDQMKSSHCQVPLQDNSSDCGLYLLQYVECFLKDPVVHFDLPLQLRKWFSCQVVRKKRDEIRNLILNLYRHQNLDSKNT